MNLCFESSLFSDLKKEQPEIVKSPFKYLEVFAEGIKQLCKVVFK